MSENTKVVEELNGLLADATIFYQKLRHYHWNIAGREFFTLHQKFEELYTGWADSIDQLAERILMIEGVPLHTLHAMLRAASLQEDESLPAAPEMVDAIVADLLTLRTRARSAIEAAEGAGDRGTVNLLDALLDAVEKETWMLTAWKKQAAWA